jgi:hypothetical protein
MGNNPEIALKRVLFPAPFAPNTVTISPSLTVREIPLRASIEP